ncbi:TPA: ArsR family transcriptional regulator [Patescibacteria group bacterium]|nr:ArsR family transcriptional regulator [Candidatus Gracilibacteria bacterium]
MLFENMKCTCDDLSLFSKELSTISQIHRLQIICMLSKVKSLCVCEIIQELGIKQNLVSHHLKVLKELNLLTTERKGQNIHYAINKEVFGEFTKIMKHLFTI